MMVTLATVRVVLLMKARSTTSSRVWSTSEMFSHRAATRSARLNVEVGGLAPVLAGGQQDERERDEEDDDGDEDRDDADDQAAALFSFHLFGLLPVEEDRHRHDDRGDDEEQHHVAGGGQAVEAGLVLLVDDRGDHVAGEPGPALGHRPDEVERPQAADQRQQDDGGGGRPQQRQGDVPEASARRWRRRPWPPRSTPAGSPRCRRCRSAWRARRPSRRRPGPPRQREVGIGRASPGRSMPTTRQRLVDQPVERVHQDLEGDARPRWWTPAPGRRPPSAGSRGR